MKAAKVSKHNKECLHQKEYKRERKRERDPWWAPEKTLIIKKMLKRNSIVMINITEPDNLVNKH